MHHWTTRAYWIGNASFLMSTSLISFARSCSGMASRTSRLLLTYLASLNPPRESKVHRLPTCSTAFCSAGRDFKQSSTKKFLLTVLMTFGGKLWWLSSAVLRSARFCASRWSNGPEQVNNHLIFLQFVRHIAILPPKKTQKGTVKIWNSHLVEHVDSMSDITGTLSSRNLKRTPTSELVRSWPLYSQPPKQAFLRELVFRPSSTENNIPFPLFYSRGNYWRS